LINLLNECEKLGIVIKPEFKTNAAAFENYYTASRYPDTTPGIPPSSSYDKKKTNEIRDQAKSIIDFAKQERKARVKP